MIVVVVKKEETGRMPPYSYIRPGDIEWMGLRENTAKQKVMPSE